jgi:hypothetical protein
MFYFLADFGHFNERNHELLTNISILLERELPKFVLFGGDNFYPSGIIESNKKYYENEFKKYFHKKLYNIYGVLGNHDYMGNIKYQIQNPNIFNIPYNYYMIKYKNYDIYMIDTQILSPYMNSYQNIIYNNLNSNHDMDKVLKEHKYKQLEWLDNKLFITKKENRIPIIIGHYPIYSDGYYKNNNNNNKLFEVLLPLFLKYQIPLYISGHDHIAQVTEHKIDILRKQYNTCTNIDPIVYKINKNLNDQLNNLNSDYLLTTVVSGSSIDLYTKLFNEYHNDKIKFYNDDTRLVLKIELKVESIKLSFIENINNNFNTKYQHVISY